MVYSKTGRYSCMQLSPAQLAMVPPISLVLFCFACITIHARVRSSHGLRCIRAGVQNSTQPRFPTPLAIYTGTPGLYKGCTPRAELSCHRPLSDHVVGGCVSIAPARPDCHQSLLISSVITITVNIHHPLIVLYRSWCSTGFLNSFVVCVGLSSE